MSENESVTAKLKKNGSSYVLWISKNEAEYIRLKDKLGKKKELLVKVSLSFREEKE